MALKRTRKKGSITDLPFLMAGILAVAIVAFLVTIVVNRINTEVQANDFFPSDAQSASTNMADSFPAVMDGGIVFLFFGLCLVSFVLASLIPVHPAFLLFYIFEWLILIWLGGGIANAYQHIVEIAAFSFEASQYSLTIHFFRYFPFIVGVVGIVLAIIMYKVKTSFTGEIGA